MGLKSGLAAQIGFATESTVNTPAAPTLFLPLVDESLALEMERVSPVTGSDRALARHKAVVLNWPPSRPSRSSGKESSRSYWSLTALGTLPGPSWPFPRGT